MEIHLDARNGYLRLNVSCRDAGPLPPRLLCPNVAPRVSRKSSNFSGRIVGAMFMRVNLKCVQVPNYAGLMERSSHFTRGSGTYRVADFRTDDFGEGFDVIVASLSLHHLELSERPV